MNLVLFDHFAVQPAAEGYLGHKLPSSSMFEEVPPSWVAKHYRPHKDGDAVRGRYPGYRIRTVTGTTRCIPFSGPCSLPPPPRRPPCRGCPAYPPHRPAVPRSLANRAASTFAFTVRRSRPSRRAVSS